LISTGTLLLELSLTRVLSVALWHHFSFLVISTALLGFGASGATLSLWSSLRERVHLDRALAGLSLTFGATTIISYWTMQRIPFDPFGLLINRVQMLLMPLYYLNLTVPFFFSGLVIALLFSRGSKEVNRLYAADLFGAGIGCSLIAVVMPAFGGSGSVLVAASLGFLAVAAFGYSQARQLAVAGGVLVLTTLLIAFWGDHLIPISVLPSKLHPLQPAGAQSIYTAWSAISKVDVYKLPRSVDKGRPQAGFSIIIDDGAAGTEVPDMSGGVRDYLARSSDFRGAGLVYLNRPHAKTLVIGSGAGREVLEGLIFGASSITAVEINPVINKIVTRVLRSSWGGLFEQPEVHLVTEDGRSFVHRSNDTYDAIISVQTMSDAALLSGAMNLSETYVLTREAFEDYYDHLTTDGILMFTRPKHQIPKLMTTAREMFERRGLGNGANHLFVFRGPVLPYGHTRFLTCFLMKKSPWTPDEIAAMEKHFGIGEPHQEVGEVPEVYYSPYEAIQEKSSYNRRLYDLLDAQDLQAVYNATSELLAPATDDQPFFNQRVRWTALRPSLFKELFRQVFSSGKAANVDYQPVAEVSLVVLLVQSIVSAGILILIPMIRFSRQGLCAPGRWRFLIYFAGLGLGFIMIEMALLQRFTLFLGQPVYTLAVVLAGLLLSTGAGSYVLSRFRPASRWSLVPIVVLILGAVAATAVLTPYVFSIAIGLQFPWRIVISLAVIAPLGFLLGMPFPSGIRIVAEEAPQLVPWAWGINGFFTVIGSVSSVILAMAFGFRVVLTVAAASYLIALCVIVVPGPYVLALHRRPALDGDPLAKNLTGAGTVSN
jgi:hypothetical protein